MNSTRAARGVKRVFEEIAGRRGNAERKPNVHHAVRLIRFFADEVGNAAHVDLRPFDIVSL